MMHAEARRPEPERKRRDDEDEDVVTSAPTLESLGVSKEGPKGSGLSEDEKRDFARARREEALAAVERDVLAKEKAAADAKAKETAEKDLEDAFFSRGDKMTAAHQAGETMGKNAAELRADASDETLAMRTERDRLAMDLTDLESRVARTGRTLRDTYGIGDPVQALADRAKAGALGKAKRLFGGLFSRASRDHEKALDIYDKVSNELAEKRSRFNELSNRLERPEAVRAAMQAKAERNQPRPNR